MEELEKRITAKLDTLQKSVDDANETLQDDVNDITTLKNKFSSIEIQLKTIIELLPNQTRVIRQTVENSIDSNMKPVQDVKQSVDALVTQKPKIMYLITRTSFWDFLFRRNKKKLPEVKGGEQLGKPIY